MYKIHKDFPIPDEAVVTPKYPLTEMEIGDCFETDVSNLSEIEDATSEQGLRKKFFPKEIRVPGYGSFLRIWRTA